MFYPSDQNLGTLTQSCTTPKLLIAIQNLQFLLQALHSFEKLGSYLLGIALCPLDVPAQVSPSLGIATDKVVYNCTHSYIYGKLIATERRNLLYKYFTVYLGRHKIILTTN